MGSQIFETDMYKGIEANILRVINNEKGFLSGRTASSPRAAGDAIESIIADNFEAILGDVCSEYSAHFDTVVKILCHVYSLRAWCNARVV